MAPLLKAVLLGAGAGAVAASQEEDLFTMALVFIVVGGVAFTLLMWRFTRNEALHVAPALRMFTPLAFTKEELKWYNGDTNTTAARQQRNFDRESRNLAPAAAAEHPLPVYDDLVLMSVKGIVYSVSPDWYGPGMGYNIFAACDCSRQLAKVIVSDAEINADWTVNLTDKEMGVLDDWEDKLKSKYHAVGWFTPDAEFTARARTFEPSVEKPRPVF
jgi:membrane-associated progesterone receptor component